MALHTRQQHPHVHLVVKAEGIDGRRLHIDKAMLREWREDFARNMRDQGIASNATPRAVRGQGKKAMPAAPPQRRPRKASTPRLQDKRYVERLPEIDQVLGTHDVERITGRHRCTIYRWVCAGTFPGKRAGGGKGWLRSDVERWLKGGDSIAAS